jgi:hypothetical protein
MDTEVTKMAGMGTQQPPPDFMMGGKFQQSTSSMGGVLYQDGNSVSGGYGNSTLRRAQEANGYYSEFDGRESAAAVEKFSGFALPESYLGNYYTQVRKSDSLDEKIIEVFRKIPFYTGIANLLSTIDCQPVVVLLVWLQSKSHYYYHVSDYCLIIVDMSVLFVCMSTVLIQHS